MIKNNTKDFKRSM